MPTYQYECGSCGHAFEILQSMSDNRLKKCPKCKKQKLERLIGTGSGIIFKGSGFYQTDYKNKGASKAEPPKEAPAKAPCSGSCACHPASTPSKN